MPSGARAPHTFLPNEPPAHPTHVLGTPHSLRFTRATHFLELPSLPACADDPSELRALTKPTGTKPKTKPHRSSFKPANHQTKMCRYFLKGSCDYGERCYYSHFLKVPKELKCVPAAPPSPHTPGKENQMAAPFARSPADVPPLRS